MPNTPKLEIILGCIGYFVEVRHYTAIFTESRPVSLGQHGVDTFMLSRDPGLNGTGGVWTLTEASPNTSVSRITEAHKYCSEQWGGDFEPYKNGWEPGRVKNGVWTPTQQATCSDETPPASPPASPSLCSPETDSSASGT